MKKLQRKTIGLALLAIVAFGGVSASAKQTARQQTLSGIVTSVDINARTVVVREQGTGRTILVRIPADKTVRTNLATAPSVPIERLLPGMVIRDIVVQ